MNKAICISYFRRAIDCNSTYKVTFINCGKGQIFQSHAHICDTPQNTGVSQIKCYLQLGMLHLLVNVKKKGIP